MSAKKSGGLPTNPLLIRTESPTPHEKETIEEIAFEQEDIPTRTHVEKPTRLRTNTSTSKPVDVSTGTTKFTFYYTEEQLERLDQAWMKMRKGRRGKRKRLNKSQFVQLAVDRLLDQFDENPDEIIKAIQNRVGE